MADRDDEPSAGRRSPGFDVERAGDVTEHRVARLADVDSAAPTAPVASLHDIGASGGQAAVVDLRQWRRTGGRPDGSGDLAEPAVTSQTPGALRSDSALCEERVDSPVGKRSGRVSRVDQVGDGDNGDVDGGNGDVDGDVDGAVGGGVGTEVRGRGRGRARGQGRGGDRGARDEIGSDPVAIAREICLRLLTDRARTRGELADALRRRGVPDDAAEMVLARFDEVGLIDDAAFAGQWVRSRHHHRGLARRAIAVELRRKGVADEVAQDALAEVDSASEERRARELVDRKLRTIPADTPEQRISAARRLVGMLARKGYPGGIAYSVVRAALAGHGADEDELAADADL